MTTIEWAIHQRGKAHKSYDKQPSEETYKCWQRWKEVVEALRLKKEEK